MQNRGGGNGGYQSSEAVLADARRRADQIRREAEREAARIRREAAAWAADARAEAEDHRDRIYADLEALADRFERELEPGPDPARGGRVGHERPPGEVIDLRAAAEARSIRVHADHGSVDEQLSRHRPAAAAVDHDDPPAAEVRDHPVIETSIETKVNDVVRLALRRTFEQVRRHASG
ncbi:MAG: hypothetical protein U5K30_16040 [Acidimicrobiales bacterium]|nr:hypothetical protein [Acidimicrobiales bacterium]